jgi:hypothetical protein
MAACAMEARSLRPLPSENSRSPDGHRPRTLPLIVALGFITAFDAMAIDRYLPAFRVIGRSFGANLA